MQKNLHLKIRKELPIFIVLSNWTLIQNLCTKQKPRSIPQSFSLIFRGQLHPIWNEEFQFEITQPYCTFRLTLMEQDSGVIDELKVPLADLQNVGNHEKWWDLRVGRIRLQFNYIYSYSKVSIHSKFSKFNFIFSMYKLSMMTLIYHPLYHTFMPWSITIPFTKCFSKPFFSIKEKTVWKQLGKFFQSTLRFSWKSTEEGLELGKYYGIQRENYHQWHWDNFRLLRFINPVLLPQPSHFQLLWSALSNLLAVPEVPFTIKEVGNNNIEFNFM